MDRDVAQMRREIGAWRESARRAEGDVMFYRDLLDKVAVLLGPAVYTSDDGSVQQDPVRIKIPDLVAQMKKDLAEERSVDGPSQLVHKSMYVQVLAQRDEAREEKVELFQGLSRQLKEVIEARDVANKGREEALEALRLCETWLDKGGSFPERQMALDAARACFPKG